jgi:hypothetical protein
MEKMPLPAGLEMLQTPDGVLIGRRAGWFGSAYFSLLFGGLLFFMGYAGHQAFASHDEKTFESLLVFGGFMALFLGWLLISYVFNSRYGLYGVIISKSGVRCGWHQLPWGDRDERIVAAGDIRQVRVEQRLNAKTFQKYYVLMYLDAANRDGVLGFSMHERDQADFIAASIREILGLNLSGEYSFYLASSVPPIRKTPPGPRGSWRK